MTDLRTLASVVAISLMELAVIGLVLALFLFAAAVWIDFITFGGGQ